VCHHSMTIMAQATALAGPAVKFGRISTEVVQRARVSYYQHYEAVSFL
jgi:hypothetical protein